MTSTVKQAAMGTRSAMRALYNSKKQEVFFLCSLLLDHTDKAQNATRTVFAETWKKLEKKQPETEEEFSELLLQTLARHCQTVMAKEKGGSSAPKAAKSVPQTDPDTEEYSGSVEAGVTYFRAALNRLEPRQRLAFLLMSVKGVPAGQFASALQIKEDTVPALKDAAESGVSALTGLLRERGKDADIPAYGQLKSLYEQGIAAAKLSPRTEEECLADIRELGKFRLTRKGMIITGIAAVAAGLLIAAAIIIPKAVADMNHTDYYADIDIKDYGTITVELDHDAAPTTVDNFVNLAESGFYDGLTFHRIMEGFMMQGGDPEGNGTGGSDKQIKGEFSANGYDNPISHVRGTISMARATDYNSASSQFFIVHQDATASLDGLYAGFGHVTSGMEIVDKICTEAKPTDSNGTIPAAEQPIINSIKIRR